MLYFEVDHSNFYKPDFSDIWVVNFPIVSFRMINYLNGVCSGRLIKRVGALDKIWGVPQPQQPITIWQPSAITVRECRNMPAV